MGTLLFSLFDKHTSLDQWCAEFARKGYALERKLEHEPSGKVTQEELRYCRQDVLKAGSYGKGQLFPTERGTPQGGVATPLTQKVISSLNE